MDSPRPSFVKRPLVKWTLRLAGAVALILATLVVGGGIQAVANVPDLQPWHRLAPGDEVHASDLDETFTLDRYLAAEARIFAEVGERIEAEAASAQGAVANRYDPHSISSPRQDPHAWNRTFEMTPENVRGGALLVHGLTDSPYSMRALAQVLSDAGFYALALRVPGHGTTPAALAEATAEDWMAAVRMGARHVRGQIGPERPLVLVGYSNGGALVLRYALAATADPELPAASRIVLVSPMIGVNPLARIVRVISALGPLPFFEKARWIDVVPEYNPYKFNSFPANAAQQSYRMSSMLQAELAAAEAAGRTAALPPILTFQSVVDATVSTQAVVSNLYDRLPAGGHELVVFDINRLSGLEPFIRQEDAGMVARLAAGAARQYRRTLITNVATDTLEVRARTVAPGAMTIADEPLGLQWPAQMFSLSHVALPFRPDDALYGSDPPVAGPGRLVSLGRLSPRGEKAVLTVPIDTLMRVGWNPFFPYVARRVAEWVQ
jgi:alpha-beta hydrolase superfamily lysophospholipase